MGRHHWGQIDTFPEAMMSFRLRRYHQILIIATEVNGYQRWLLALNLTFHIRNRIFHSNRQITHAFALFFIAIDIPVVEIWRQIPQIRLRLHLLLFFAHVLYKKHLFKLLKLKPMIIE